MKCTTFFACFVFSGMAALLCPVAAPASPLFSPLLRPAPLTAFLTPPVIVPQAPAWAQPLGSLGNDPFWSRALDPSLRLTDWSHVFDIAALGSFTVPVRQDPAERTNILLAAQAVDNVTIAPGAEFSFNAQVGERTPERGYQDGLMFDNGHVVRGTGGGICLVATGLYNAALQAGLEITERHSHSGLVSYAPPGCDAGIVYGQEDLKFRNTTARLLVIRAQPEEGRLTLDLFGQTPPPGRQVIVKPLSLETLPYAVITQPDPALLRGQSIIDQTPRLGYDVVVGRFWTVRGRVVRREIVVHERRVPRNKIVRVAVAPVVTEPPAAPSLPAVGLPLTPPSPPSDAEPGD